MIKIPTPKVAEATKPITSLALGDVKVEGSCVAKSKLNDDSSSVIKTEKGEITWAKSCKEE